MEGIILTAWMMVLGPVILFFVVRRRTFQKMLCELLDSDGSIRSKLVRVQGDWIFVDGERYLVKSEMIKWKRYPTGWPVWLQQTVPCALYLVGRTDPIDWTEPSREGVSSAELAAILDPHWMQILVRGVSEVSKDSSRENRIMSMIAVGTGVLSVLLTIYVISRLIALESIVGV